MAGTGIAGVLWMKIPNCLNRVVSSPNNVTRFLCQRKYSQLLNGSIINSYIDCDVGEWRAGLNTAMERSPVKLAFGVMRKECRGGRVAIINQVDRGRVKVSNADVAFWRNNNIYIVTTFRERQPRTGMDEINEGGNDLNTYLDHKYFKRDN